MIREFTGIEACTLDGSGRLKFSPRYRKVFDLYDNKGIYLHCLPEKAMAIFPADEWGAYQKERERYNLQSMVSRRRQRLTGAMTQPEELSNQWRVTLPAMFRKFCDLEAGSEVYLVGCGNCIEVWNPQLWEKELELMREHSLEKGENEMNRDLINEE